MQKTFAFQTDFTSDWYNCYCKIKFDANSVK